MCELNPNSVSAATARLAIARFVRANQLFLLLPLAASDATVAAHEAALGALAQQAVAAIKIAAEETAAARKAANAAEVASGGHPLFLEDGWVWWSNVGGGHASAYAYPLRAAGAEGLLLV